MNEEVDIEQPCGFSENNNLVCRLHKALYGLKQTSKCWNNRFHKFLTKIGFTRSNTDHCLYTLDFNGQEDLVHLLLYVDDIILASGSIKRINELKCRLEEEFEIEDCGILNYYLGIKIEYNVDKAELKISQGQYLKNVLQRLNMSDCKPRSIPIETKLELSINTPTTTCSQRPRVVLFFELSNCRCLTLSFCFIPLKTNLCKIWL